MELLSTIKEEAKAGTVQGVDETHENRGVPITPQETHENMDVPLIPDRIYDRNIPAHQWLADYIGTYVQRDVRQVINVGDLQVFTGFLKLCAGRTAQEINLSALGSDAGVSHNTARAWLSVLETSYLIHRLPAWHPNIRKQVVKAPKLHFFDSGLVCYLLGFVNRGSSASILREEPSLKAGSSLKSTRPACTAASGQAFFTIGRPVGLK
jgi:predicted AAA+ superfamily ATPase